MAEFEAEDTSAEPGVGKRKMTSDKREYEPITHFMDPVKFMYYKYLMCRE